MKVTILAYGTRGDVQPFVALAHGLQEVGHEVTLAAPTNFESWVKSFGLKYAPLHGDAQAILESEEGQKWLAAGNALKFLAQLGKIAHEMRGALQRDAAAACAGAEAILATVMTTTHGLCMAEKLRVPLINVFTIPFGHPSSHFANVLVSPKPLPFKFLNRLSHRLVEHFDWKAMKADVNEWRAELGLPAMSVSHHEELRRRRTPGVHVYSSHLFPRPDDWSTDVQVTGSLVLSAVARKSLPEGVVPTDFSDWLAAGPPPVFLGFGSMPVLDPLGMLELVRDVANDLKVRAVIGAGWSRVPPGLSNGVFVVGAIDHDWLFPRCAAVVHHGGAGTTATSIRAGAPTVICSVFSDQPFWGRIITERGLGATLRYQELSRDSLKAALTRALEPSVKAKAVEFGQKLKSEDGVARAVAAIQRALKQP